MKYFFIDGKMDGELLQRFISFVNDNQAESWTIILNTAGGKTDVGETVLFIINENKEKCTLIAHNIYSAGFNLFYNAKCSKYLTPSSKGMYHMATAELWMRPDGKASYYEDRCITKNMKAGNEIDKEFIKGFMTEREQTKFNKGDDVFFTYDRLREIFPGTRLTQ